MTAFRSSKPRKRVSLAVVRHGQASFGAKDYDQLSELGTQQSTRLGSYWAGQERSFDAVYCGPAKRHQQTLAAISAAISKSAGAAPLPVAKQLDGLGEFPAFKLYDMHAANEASRDVLGDAPSFEEIIEAWMQGSIECGELMTAAQFQDKVASAFKAICAEQDGGKTCLVVTSGGPTMIAMKLALGVDTTRAAALLWPIANSSVAEFRAHQGALNLAAFNRIAHLDPSQVTYR